MTGPPDSKFRWIWALGADPRLGYAERYVLTITALKSASPRDLTFCIRQTSIAENCAASEATVRRALAAGRRHGYIELVKARKRGRGNRGADEYRLTLPDREIPSRVTAIPDPKYRSPATKIEVTGDENTDQVQVPDQCELPPPLGLLEVSRRSAADAAPPPEPSRYCPRHPNDTDEDCRPCGRHREAHERWQADKADHERRVAEAVGEVRRACRLCGGDLWVIGSDGTPVEPAQPCPVCKLARSHDG